MFSSRKFVLVVGAMQTGQKKTAAGYGVIIGFLSFYHYLHFPHEFAVLR
jgi:hypothetical protein